MIPRGPVRWAAAVVLWTLVFAGIYAAGWLTLALLLWGWRRAYVRRTVRRRPARSAGRAHTANVVDRRGKVYLLECRRHGLWKIGFTDRTARERFEELQRATPERLRIDTFGVATERFERALHDRYQHRWTPNHLPAGSEWFALTGGEVDEVRAILSATRRTANR